MVIAGGDTARAGSPGGPAPSHQAAWHIVESDNFRVLNFGPCPAGAEAAQECEVLRQGLIRRWMPASQFNAWRPKCDLVLHPNDESYFRAVGAGGRSTVASALVEHRHGRVVARRIDVRASRAGWQFDALPHELTHVVIADRFNSQFLPRWIDEGIAIQADPADKRQRHRQGCLTALAHGHHFRLPELLELTDYPPAGRWAAFYDQSATMVEFLVAQQGTEAFLKFVDLALSRGYQHAAQAIYQTDLSQLETQWRAALTGASQAPSQRQADASNAPPQRWTNGRARGLATTSS